MPGSSDGLIRFWENEGDALWIVKIALSVFLYLLFCTLFRKVNVFALFVQKGNISFITRGY